MGIQWDHVGDEDTEPPVPAGLKDLSGALQAIADFLEIDQDLIAVAAAASPASTEEVCRRPSRLDRYAACGRQGQVPHHGRRRRGATGPGPPAATIPWQPRCQNAAAPSARTAAELWTAAGARKAVREEAEAEARRAEEERQAAAKAAAHSKRLDHLASRAEAAWQEAADLIETKKPRDYDLASHC